MINTFSRRNLLQLTALALPLRVMKFPARLFGSDTGNAVADPLPLPDIFPAHSPELAREMVTVAHFDLERVKQLTGARPALARAAWDWGFGDWETALGAASHMGNRPIAEYLITQGARPSLFSAAMLGQLDVVKGFVTAGQGVQRIRGPHSISLLAHARMGGEAARPVYDYLQALGDADAGPPAALPDAEAAALVGTYVFGPGITQQIEVNADMKMYANNKMYTYAPQLNWVRKGTMPRSLFHLGDHAFYPAGAPSVRIRFTQDAGRALMTITDGDLVVTARKQ